MFHALPRRTGRDLRSRTRGVTLLALLLAGPLTTPADAWDFRWITQFGDAGTEVSAGVLIKGNAVYVAGYRRPPGASSSDGYLRKYNRTGSLVWADQFGTTASEVVNGVVALDDMIVVAGGTNGTFPGQTPAGSRDVFLRAYKSTGEVLWTKQFGTPAFDGLGINGLATDGRAIYVAGETFGTFPGEPINPAVDTFVAKIDAQGDLLWLHQLGIRSFTRLGLVGVSADEHGVVVVGSFLEGPEETDAGGGFIRRLSTNGELEWQQDLVRRDLCQTTFWGVSIHDHVAYVVGQWLDLTFPDPDAACTNPSDSPVVGVVRAYNVKNGTLKWQRRIKGRTVPGGENFTGAKVISASDAGVFVGANLTESFAGHWQPTPPQRPECPGLNPGFPDIFPDSLDAYVRRYSLDGDVVWTHQFGGPVFDLVTAISADSKAVAAVGDTSCGIDSNHAFGGGARDVFVVRIGAEPTTIVGFIQLLIGRLETRLDAGRLQERDFNALVQLLEDALKALETGSPSSARHTLLRVADQVDALTDAGQLLNGSQVLRGFARELAEKP